MKDNEEVIDVVAGFDEATLRRIMNQTYNDITPVENIIDIAEGMFSIVDQFDVDDEIKNFFYQLSRNFHLNKNIYEELKEMEKKKLTK